MKIKFNNLKKQYEMFNEIVVALDDVSGEINENVTVIVGPSGGGKSTLLNMVGLIDKLDSGSIDIDGEKITDLSSKKKTEYIQENIGIIFQSYNLISNLTVKENIYVGSHKKIDEAHFEDVTRSLDIHNLLDKFPAELSGGQQQRVTIARAILKKPKLILCDEPTGALDEETAKNVLALLLKNSESDNIKLIIVTHEPAITKIADEVITFRNGKIASQQKNSQKIAIDKLEF